MVSKTEVIGVRGMVHTGIYRNIYIPCCTGISCF